jgi:succinyl-CoA synthetase alpha subunit
MSILVDKNTRVAVQGITGKQGSFHTRLMLEEGSQIVAGVVPGKGGQDFEGIPIYDTILEAKIMHDVDACIGFVPPRFALQSISDAIDAGIGVIVNLADGVPVRDMMNVRLKLNGTHSWVIGPNTPGIITPKQCKLGFMPSRSYAPGVIGVMSKSGSLSYEVCNEITKAGIGQTTVVGIGGDRIPGTGFDKLIPLFEKDSETKGMVIVGEIGGVAEEKAASVIRETVTKPVVALLAGKSAPPGKAMGHAGAIITQGKGTFQSKVEAFGAAGVQVLHTPKDLVAALRKLL